MSLEAAIRSMLVTGTTLSAPPNGVPDERVTHGFRLQSTDLPAVTFEVQSVEPASISGVGSTSSGHRLAQVEVRSIAPTMAVALEVAAKVRSRSVSGTFAGINLRAVLYQGHRVEPSDAGEGDEAQPAEAVSELTIYYTE
jgi:hypothetical protein